MFFIRKPLRRRGISFFFGGTSITTSNGKRARLRRIEGENDAPILMIAKTKTVVRWNEREREREREMLYLLLCVLHKCKPTCKQILKVKYS